MFNNLSPFFLYLVLFVPVASAVALVLLRVLLMKRGSISHSLNLQLLSVKFPPPAQPQGQQEPTLQQIRERIALMDQLYSHLHVVRDSWWHGFFYGKPVFALELTIPHIGEEISFYMAVPRRLVPAIAKIIQGIFPEAHVEPSKDYNIFNPDGESAGSYVMLRQNRYYPVRTYQKLETDPMRSLANVFTKLALEGEGAVLQIVARPAARKWRGRLRQQARLIFEGKRGYRGDTLSRVAKTLGDIVETVSAEPQQPQKQEPLKRLTPLEEEMVKNLEGKASKALFEANIRLIASAPTLDRAREIMEGLEVAFGQFDDPNLNSFTIFKTFTRSLRDLIFRFSFRMFDWRKKIVLAADELTSLFHFPNVPLETPKLKIQKAREAPPPANLPKEGLLLGYNLFRGQTFDIKMLDEDRRRHLYVIGQTGTGKTAFLENMIVQDIENGKGVCFIDPHGDTVDRLLGVIPRHRLQDVIYFNPGDIELPMGLNMLEYDPRFPEQKTFVVNELLSMFKKLYGAVPESMGPAFEQYFRNSTLLVMDHPESGNTLFEIVRVLSNKEFRAMKLSHSTNPVVRQFWENAEKTTGEQALANFVPYVTNKFDTFIANEIMRPIIGQERSAFNFREVMDNGRILLINLSKGRLGDLNSSLIGLIMVGKLLMASLSRTDTAEEKRKDFYLYIDEFQNVTTDSIATILSEARKYRLDLIITHQFIGQLAEEIKKAVFGNVGSMVSFRIGSDDAEFMAKQYKPIFGEQDLLNIDNRNCYVKLLINGATAPPFSMKTYPPAKGDREAAETVREISRLKYGRKREEVEEEIKMRYERQASPL